jgi:hypothetical protein
MRVNQIKPLTTYYPLYRGQHTQCNLMLYNTGEGIVPGMTAHTRIFDMQITPLFISDMEYFWEEMREHKCLLRRVVLAITQTEKFGIKQFPNLNRSHDDIGYFYTDVRRSFGFTLGKRTKYVGTIGTLMTPEETAEYIKLLKREYNNVKMGHFVIV